MIDKFFNACQVLTESVAEVVGEVVDDDAPRYIEASDYFAETWSWEKDETDDIVEHDDKRIR